MLFEFFHRVITLDFSWLITLVANNLLFLFLFAALIFFFFDGKRVAIGVVAFSILVWAWMDFELISGLAVLAGGFLVIYYITKMAVLMFVNEMPELKTKLIWVSEAQFLLVFVIYNIFLR